MPNRTMHFCRHAGCDELTEHNYCPEHEHEHEERRREQFDRYDKQRGSSAERGYDARWQKYSKWFLKQPQNQICKLHLPGCTLIAKCVDHIDPPSGPDDPKFWDKNNHQPACIRCNSVKGHTKIVGRYDMMGSTGG